ncbi:hypothetical protein [Lactococcus taiwanensis]|jgi:hypothetical protein|uniref:Uncharacterized protein n=1 Tax=Lactococcus taiwanensis TaxID=1151742 RepID=A0AA45KGU7_9LACT|nr:hypothetical protein [Lactococcus taiwanensis]KZK38087.1 hypothetical protein P7266_0780 [Lactococcus cremoris]QRZ10613.1 hypothetical protein JVB21_07425 [Lactococcus taiwanensis]QSE77014.1 hypothetical protein JW886_01760 [Lactococcus taiwanensis]
MFVLLMLLALFLMMRGMFKIVLPVLVLLLIVRVLFGGLMLLLSPHFLGTVLVIAFIVWLVKASRGPRFN